jgi:hypothetical protein
MKRPQRSGNSQLRGRVSGGAGALVLAALLLSGCATGSIYRPKGAADGIGYAEEQIAPLRYRVSFSGTRDTPRVEVEDYLMLRAAELTLQAGHTHFAFERRSTEADSQYYTFADSWNPSTGLGFGLGRRDPERAEYFSNFAFRTNWSADKATLLTRYTAYSDVILLTPEQATTSPIALSAREILDRLAPRRGRGDMAATGAAFPAQMP